MILIDHPAEDIPEVELFDNRTQEFITIPAAHHEAFHLQLEHSLMSIAKWEGRWHSSFFASEQMTPEQFIDYIRCMTINTQKNPQVYEWLKPEDIQRISAYMLDPMSAHEIVSKGKKKKGKWQKPDTAETYYHAMFQLNIPMDCEKWHFNRLAALIDLCGNEGGGGKAMSQRETMELYKSINERNRKKFHSKG